MGDPETRERHQRRRRNYFARELKETKYRQRRKESKKAYKRTKIKMKDVEIEE